ncbi:hypothetical protein BDZ97DRAFT_1906350 [Flammula alnicola]|nr:hypothetical protein BDZ97DRAFT_1906350 [Flammula alnicola]
MENLPHPDLQSLKLQLLQIHDAIANFKPLTERPPILDSSFDAANEINEENQWLHQESVPGLKKLRENIKIDLGVLEKFLDDPQCINLPALSTNAPYLIAVWNEVVCERVHPPGSKVDVVADNGRRWIRVNTVKNSRMLSEFREIDSYLTDSEEEPEEDWDDAERPSLAQTEFDNSVLRMGRSLLKAAKANPIEGSLEIPKVTLRLTRLDPHLLNDDGTPPDPRIAQTLDCLRNMGVDVALGERTSTELPDIPNGSNESPSETIAPSFIPTTNINLDLSVIIALISDLTHAPLPNTIEEANRRLVPPQEYREWKQKRQAMNGKHKKSHATPDPSGSESPGMETDINDLPRDLIKHARALTNQLLQEMGKSLLQELHDKITSSATGEGDALPMSRVVFWTTSEARDRCLRIVSKIGGIHEKRRARAMFCLGLTDAEKIPLEEAESLYWKDSRFPLKFIPFLPIRIFPTPSPDFSTSNSSILDDTPQGPKSSFGISLAKVCADILSQETIPRPRALPEDVINMQSSGDPLQFEIQRAIVTKANPRLTAHTVRSMQWGAELRWTTLTANRTSVKAIIRELKAARIAGRLAALSAADEEVDEDNFAAIWIVDPRSLAEGMSSQSSTDRPH